MNREALGGSSNHRRGDPDHRIGSLGFAHILTYENAVVGGNREIHGKRKEDYLHRPLQKDLGRSRVGSHLARSPKMAELFYSRATVLQHLPPYPHGYSLNEKKQRIDESAVLAPSVSWAAGATISDIPDMKRLVKAYVSETTNSAATQKARLTCPPTGVRNLSFGLGIWCSAGWYGHTGGIGLQYRSLLHARDRGDNHRFW